MPGYLRKNSINRVIDANLNRAKEGLRVCEEVTRFILDDRDLTLELKKIRHAIDSVIKKSQLSASMLLSERRSIQDVGRKMHVNELKRKNIPDIFFANMQRVKESIRVLEEFSKLINKNFALQFKKIRYDTYEVEKKVARKFSASLRLPIK